MGVVVKKEDQSAKELATLVNKDNILFAGVHLLVDLWGAKNLDSPEEIEKILRECADISGATILYSYMHPFEPHGVSGVVVLAESHISIHTWPEREYVALDIFMCGACDPYKGVEHLKKYFMPQSIQISENKRGVTI